MITTTDVRDDDVIVDNTILVSTLKCSTQSAMHHVLGLTTQAESADLEAGSAVHEVLAWRLAGQPQEVAMERLHKYRAWVKANPLPEKDAERLAYSNVRAIVKHWFKQHPLDDTKKWPFVVKPEHVEVPLVGTLGFWTGKSVKQGRDYSSGQRVLMVALLDALAKRRTGGRWSVDHKTTKSLNDYFQTDQEDSSQFTGQLWLGEQNGLELGGIFINGIELRVVPSSMKKCYIHKVPYSECGLAHVSFKLFPITRTPHEIAAWEQTARLGATKYLKLREKVKSAEDVKSLPMEGRFVRACSRCAFRDWCRVGRPTGAVRSFVKKEWKPLEHAMEQAAAVAEARK